MTKANDPQRELPLIFLTNAQSAQTLERSFITPISGLVCAGAAPKEVQLKRRRARILCDPYALSRKPMVVTQV